MKPPRPIRPAVMKKFTENLSRCGPNTKLLIIAAPILFLILQTPLLSAQPAGPEFQVNTHATGDQSFADVAMDAAGNFVVVWASFDQDGDKWGIYGQRYGSGGNPLGLELQVNTHTSSNQLRPSIAMNGPGDFVVVWWSLNQGGDDYDIYGQRYDTTANPLGSEFMVNSHAAGTQRDASIAIDGSGNFIVAWASLGQDGDGWGIYGRRYDNTGSPVGPEFQVNTYFTSHQSAPSVAMNGTGDYVVVWQSLGQDGDGSGVYGQRYDAMGNTAGPEFQINTYTANYQSDPSAALDETGNFVVVWQSFEQDGDSDGIYGQRYDNTGNPAGTEFRISTFKFDIQRTPSIAVDGSGNFTVAWQSKGQEGGCLGVFGRQYDSMGIPLDLEFQVNTYTTDNQWNASIAMDAAGDFVIVWQSFEQDGDGDGIFGQRYEP
jgi:hypothetical protein